MAKNTFYDVRIGRTEIDVPHRPNKVTLVSPALGPSTYQEVGRQILNSGLALPMEENASLVHAVYTGPEEFRQQDPVKQAENIMRANWLWTFKNVLWVPGGVYAVSDNQVQSRSTKLLVGDLERSLNGARELSWGGVRESVDGSVRFAPKGSYELGEHTPEELAKQGDVIAVYGEVGAEKLAEASKGFKDNPITWGLDIKEGKEPQQRVVSLSSNGGGGRLAVNGDDWPEVSYGGCAFGVVKEEEK